jgi:hypothetical protein
MQQWYGDVSFSGFSFDYSGMVGASSSDPPPFESPPPAHTHDDEEEEASALTIVAWSVLHSLTLLHLNPLLRLTLMMMMMMKRKIKKKKMMSEASRRPPSHLFWCLMIKGEKYQLNLEGSTQFVLVSILSGKIRLSGFAQQNFYPSCNFIFPVDLRTL